MNTLLKLPPEFRPKNEFETEQLVAEAIELQDFLSQQFGRWPDYVVTKNGINMSVEFTFIHDDNLNFLKNYKVKK